MGEFDFIPSKEEYAVIIEKCRVMDELKKPEEKAKFARELLDDLLVLICEHENIKIPETATMLEIIDSRPITRFIDYKEIIESIHFVRKLGMNAQQEIHIKKTEADTALKNIEFFLQFVITKIENPKDVKKIILPKYMSEAETRKIYIDQYLKEAGWEVLEPKETTKLPDGLEIKSGTVTPEKACCEIPVNGMKNKTGIGFCDYVLYGKDGKPLAIVEAKKTSEDIAKGVHQVKEYGRCMKEQYGYVPVLYYTNGYEIRVIDGLYVDRRVMAFHSLEELEYMLQRRDREPLDNIQVDTSIAGRPYQIQAVTKVCERFNEKYLRSLLVMATGTGKTRVSIALVKTLLDNNWIKNVLFLADRTSLVSQAFKNFKKMLPDMSYQVLSDRSLANEPNARVVFSTHQTMINYIDAEDKEYTCGRFDLIIIDEAHRSIFNKYGSIFDYFDSLLVGLTATPRSEVDADTYKLFGCESGIPHFEYKLEEAVKDHYLVPYKVEGRTTKLLQSGIKYSELSEDDKEKVESVLLEDDDIYEIPEDYIIPTSKLFKKIYNEGTCGEVLEDLLEHGLRVENGQLVGKTIIFAYNHKHAVQIVETFKKLFPNYSDDYCQLIDNKVKGADDLIIQFEENDDFRIAVSVDMLDTGIDVPSVLNLVFFKPVKSHIKFVQMIGRGTRLCEKLINGKDKEYFLIFDYCGNFEYFEEHPEIVDNSNGKTLTQKLFDVKLDIMVELQKYEYQNDDVCKAYYDKLKPELYQKTKSIKEDSSFRIAVREEMPYVDKYYDYEQWNVIAPLAKKEMQLHLSKLIDAETEEDVSSLRFDMQMLQIELAILTGGGVGSAARQVERVRKIAKYLLDYASAQPTVMEKADTLRDLVSVEYWDNPKMDSLEKYREAVRNLLVYLQSAGSSTEINIDDKVQQTDVETELIDIRTYREKILDYLAKHTDNETIIKIQNLEKINQQDLKELEKILWNELGTAEEYHENTNIDNLAVFIRSIVGIEQDAINKKFGEFLNENVLNSMQQEFIRAIINYVRENGDIELSDVLERSPFDSYDINELFGDNVYILKEVVSSIHDSVVVA